MEVLSHGTVSAEIYTGVQGKRGTASGDGGSDCRASARHRSQPPTLCIVGDESSWKLLAMPFLGMEKPVGRRGGLQNWSAKWDRALGRTLEMELTLQALRMALRGSRPAPGLVHHSDRGVQYAAQD